MWYQWDNLVVNDGFLYRKCNYAKGNVIFQLVAPAKIRDFFFSNLHCSRTAGHFGRDRTIEAIQRRYYWLGMKKDVSRWVKECDICARAKSGPGRGKAVLHQFRVNEIMRCVAIDIFGPPLVTENGNQYIIVLGDLLFQMGRCIGCTKSLRANCSRQSSR